MRISMTNTAKSIAVVGTLAFSAPTAHAGDIFSALMSDGPTGASNWDVTLGGGVLYGPKYEGSDEFKFSALPFAEVVWKEAIFVSPIDGIGVNLLSHEGFEAGLALGYDFGRDEDDSKSELRGMGDIEGGVSTSGFLSYDMGLASANMDVKKYFAGSEGITVDLGIKAFVPLSLLMGEGMPAPTADGKAPKVPALSLGVSTQWANDDYMQDYFGVSAAQSASSGKAAHDASAGFKSVSVETGVYVPVNENVTLGSTLTYTRLLGDAADSPITYNENQLSGAAFLTYNF